MISDELPILLIVLASVTFATQSYRADGPGPPFLNETSEVARHEFMQILAEANLTKGEMKERVHEWAERQPDNVKESVHKFERDITVAHTAMQKNAIAVIRQLEMVFVMLSSILDDLSLTRGEMEEELRRTAGTFDVDAVSAVRVIMRNAHQRVSKRFLPHHFPEPSISRNTNAKLGEVDIFHPESL
ncbi:hypothetical protein PRIPAC_77715 [Pristionchus pacificus]|nr:hypothetical protein PRIPAC_77715 [Pristionchus pacificus]